VRGLRGAGIGLSALVAAWCLATCPAPAEQVVALPDVDLALHFPREAGAPVRWEPRAAVNPPFGDAPARSMVVFADLAAAHRPVGPAGPPRAALEWRQLGPGEGDAAVDAPFGAAFLAIHELTALPCPPPQLAAMTGFGPPELALVRHAARWRAYPRDAGGSVGAYDVLAWRTATHRFTFARRGDAGGQLVVRLHMPSQRR